MAGRKSSYLYFPESDLNQRNRFGSNSEEFDESDVWGMDLKSTTDPPQSNKIPTPQSTHRRYHQLKKGSRSVAASLPMNIPDWSKILKNDYINKYNKNTIEDDEDDEDTFTKGSGMTIPPHEYLERTRAASLSVHEGIGRTLKGRDLSRVRNAVFKKTGFLD